MGGQFLEGFGQVRLNETFSNLGDVPARKKGLCYRQRLDQQVLSFLNGPAQFPVHGKPLFRVFDGLCKEPVKGQGAVPFKGLMPAVNRTGHRDGQNARFGHGDIPFALVKLRIRPARCPSAGVEGLEPAGVAFVDQREEIPTQSAHVGSHDRHDQIRGNGRIHGISAGFQDRCAGLSGQGMIGGNHPVDTHNHGPMCPMSHPYLPPHVFELGFRPLYHAGHQ